MKEKSNSFPADLYKGWRYGIILTVSAVVFQIIMVVYSWVDVLYFSGNKTSAIIWTCLYGLGIIVLSGFAIYAIRHYRQAKKELGPA